MSVVVVDHDGGARFCTYADPGIKLFGRDIPLTQESSEELSIVSMVQLSSHQDDEPDLVLDIRECQEPMDIISCKSEDSACLEVGNKVMDTSVKMGETLVKTGAHVHGTLPKVEEAQGPLAHEKTPKKPDKLLPCPRCHSLDTKFCYFNNYNVNQPRHFCRKCQRYWTAGGTLRNVPVGAGRRKNKHSASHQKLSMISDAVPVRTSTADIDRHKFSATSATASATLGSLSKPQLHVLPLEAQPVPTLDTPLVADSSLRSFGQESPLCRSLAATTLGLQENATMQNPGRVLVDGFAGEVTCTIDGKHEPGLEDCASSAKLFPPSCQMGGSLSNAAITGGVQLQEGECSVNGSIVSHELQVGEVTLGAIWQPGSTMVSRVPLKPTTPLSLDTENSSTTSFSLPTPNVLTCNGAPGSFWPGFTWPFMNPAMWGAPPLEWAGPWTTSVYPPGVAAATAAAALLPLSPNTAPQMHTERSQPEKCLWVPKTLRIDDPLNAARSSLWTTLGLGDGPLSSPAHGNAFHAKADSMDDNKPVSTRNRLSNPAALSRSVAFHENC